MSTPRNLRFVPSECRNVCHPTCFLIPAFFTAGRITFFRSVSDEYCHLNSEYLRQAGSRSREREEQKFRLGEFVRLGEASIPGLQVALEAFHRTGNWDKSVENFGRKKCDSIRWRARQRGMALIEKVRIISLNT